MKESCYKSALDYLREVNIGKEAIYSRQLKKQPKKIDKIKYFLYKNPLMIVSVLSIMWGIAICFPILLLILVENISIKLQFILSFVFMLVFIFVSIFLYKWQPKVNIEWDETWKYVTRKIIKKYNLQNENEALYHLVKEKTYYIRNGKSWSWICQILFGGIFIGCIVNPEFQKSLFFSIDKSNLKLIFDANPLGAICFFLLPILYVYYYCNFKIKINLLNNVIEYIKLEKIKGSSKN